MNKRIDEMYDASAGRQVLGSIIQKPELLSFLQNCGKLPQKARKKDALTQRERFPSLNVHLCGVSVI